MKIKLTKKHPIKFINIFLKENLSLCFKFVPLLTIQKQLIYSQNTVNIHNVICLPYHTPVHVHTIIKAMAMRQLAYVYDLINCIAMARAQIYY